MNCLVIKLLYFFCKKINYKIYGLFNCYCYTNFIIRYIKA